MFMRGIGGSRAGVTGKTSGAKIPAVTLRCAGVVVLVLLVACGGKPGTRDEKAPVGKVTAVSGTVGVRRGAEATAGPVAVGLAVTRDMVFTTGADGALEVLFDNNYTWKLAGGRERALAKLRVIDLPRAAEVQSVADELAGSDSDRTTAAGRHAEQSAAEGSSTAERPSPAAAAAPPPPTGQPAEAVEPPMAPEVPVVVENHDDGETAAAPAPPPPPPKAAAKRPEKSAKASPRGDEVDQLLRGGTGGGAPPKGGGGGGGIGAPGSAAGPDRNAIVKVINGVRPRIRQCAVDHPAKGVLALRIKISAEGKAVEVTPAGELAGTDAAKCAVDVIKGARFPAASSEISISVPFTLGE
jgi:hypothetical protein